MSNQGGASTSIRREGGRCRLIDEATLTQRLKQAEADLESTKASNRLQTLNVRTRDLFKQNSFRNRNSTTPRPNWRNPCHDADADRSGGKRPLIFPLHDYRTIDGMVLDRKTDKDARSTPA